MANRFGRRVALIVVCSGLVACSVGCAFAPTYEIYTFVRVLCGAFGITCFIAYFTYGKPKLKLFDSVQRWQADNDTKTKNFVYFMVFVNVDLTQRLKSLLQSGELKPAHT